MALKLVIFDNDGVNVNSEDLAMRVADDFLTDMVSQLSSPLEPDHVYHNFAGVSTNKIVSLLMQGRSIEPDAVMELYGFHSQQIKEIKLQQGLEGETAEREAVAFAVADLITIETIERFKRDLKAVPGVVEAHEEIGRMVGPENVILATTSRADRMDVTLEAAVNPKTGANAGLSDVFAAGARRFSGYGHPNKYTALFAELNRASFAYNLAETAVVEDSISGVRYAKDGRPDLRVVGTVAANFYNDKDAHAHKLLEAGASVVISDMHDLPLALAWLDAGVTPESRPEGFVGKAYTRTNVGGAVLPSRAP